MKDAADCYTKLLAELSAGKKAVMITFWDHDTQKQPRKLLLTEEMLNQQPCHSFDEELWQKAQNSLHTSTLQFYKNERHANFLIEPHFPEPRLILLGGGHIAQPLAEFGAKTGFCVTVVDDRPSFANPDRFPLACNVICENFSRCFSLLGLNESAYVAIITRGHRHDLDCLRQVLEYKTAYVGMIGSRHRVRNAREQLLAEGYAQERLNRVHAPIGLDIGAISPEEIAVSIIAQVIGVRRLGCPATKSAVGNRLEFDSAVLKELSYSSIEGRALVTVIVTKGSVPRKAGAKMLVGADGRTTGSIGGGCSEAEIITAARDVILTGRTLHRHIDMTGTTAEEEGMVCGGIMDVIIEPYCG